MIRMIEATYQDGILKPLIPIDGLRKNEKLRIIIFPYTDTPPKYHHQKFRKFVGYLSDKRGTTPDEIVDDLRGNFDDFSD